MGKFVYSFSEGNKNMRELLGGKGANLCEMTHLGMPVPRGFIITTEACLLYYKNKKILNKEITEEIKTCLKNLQFITHKKINDHVKPLLISVRSGSRASMPGMMDTVLNIGLNDELAINFSNTTNNKRFVYDSYRRLIMMYADVVKNHDKRVFENALDKYKKSKNMSNDNELEGNDWEAITKIYKNIYVREIGEEFPQDINTQLLETVNGVFRSWNNERAIVYRKMNNIPEEWGTAVNVQEMVYGNLNELSGTGVAFSRNPATGDNELYGEFMLNAQGEDLVSGIRTPKNINELQKLMPGIYKEFLKYAKKLERHYQDMQDMEFTVENSKLYMLQTRSGKRTSKSAIKIVNDMYKEGLINKKEAIMRISESDIENLLHDNFKPSELKINKEITKGLPASPGASFGKIYFNSEDAIKAHKNGEDVILVREETSPEDIKGMDHSNGIITVRGGMTSHAAVVARGMGKCCVCGCDEIEVYESKKLMIINGKKYPEKSEISIDGSTGFIYKGLLKTEPAKINDDFKYFMNLVYDTKKLEVRANAETLSEVKKAMELGAEGIGLARTEHMFFEPVSLLKFRKMILASTNVERELALKELEKITKKDITKILEKLNGLPFTIRYLDPPLHEFLPKNKKEINILSKELGITETLINNRIGELKEFNPMMGHRGARLLISYPQIIKMQTNAILSSALMLQKKGINSNIEIMIPLINDVSEFVFIKRIIKEAANQLFEATKLKVPYKIGAMIELPRACIKADEIAIEADFFSFGTNDLTQMSYGYSRDDASKFINVYKSNNIIKDDPFEILDTSGVGELINIAVQKSRCVKKQMKLGLCGEHGGDPKSVKFCHDIGLNYVSCSPYRIPVAALSAAKAKISTENKI